MVEIYSPGSGEAVTGVCMGKSRSGWVIEADDEAHFGRSHVLGWISSNGEETVVKGHVRPINGRFLSLRPTEPVLASTESRQHRYAVDGIPIRVIQGDNVEAVYATDLSCRGFGFVSAHPLDAGEPALFEFPVGLGALKVPGTLIHQRLLAPMLYRGGGSLNLASSEERRGWMCLLADVIKTAA